MTPLRSYDRLFLRGITLRNIAYNFCFFPLTPSTIPKYVSLVSCTLPSPVRSFALPQCLYNVPSSHLTPTPSCTPPPLHLLATWRSGAPTPIYASLLPQPPPPSPPPPSPPPQLYPCRAHVLPIPYMSLSCYYDVSKFGLFSPMFIFSYLLHRFIPKVDLSIVPCIWST